MLLLPSRNWLLIICILHIQYKNQIFGPSVLYGIVYGIYEVCVCTVVHTERSRFNMSIWTCVCACVYTFASGNRWEVTKAFDYIIMEHNAELTTKKETECVWIASALPQHRPSKELAWRQEYGRQRKKSATRRFGKKPCNNIYLFRNLHACLLFPVSPSFRLYFMYVVSVRAHAQQMFLHVFTVSASNVIVSHECGPTETLEKIITCTRCSNLYGWLTGGKIAYPPTQPTPDTLFISYYVWLCVPQPMCVRGACVSSPDWRWHLSIAHKASEVGRCSRCRDNAIFVLVKCSQQHIVRSVRGRERSAQAENMVSTEQTMTLYQMLMHVTDDMQIKKKGICTNFVPSHTRRRRRVGSHSCCNYFAFVRFVVYCRPPVTRECRLPLMIPSDVYQANSSETVIWCC